MTIGERIAQFRKDAGLSQEQLAERLGVSRQSVSKWETGGVTP
ncbi:MAG: helix-turn-helix transcriptional regulator, partial [Clostridia bacterium]|nr:helix-turn-helix transcriptional regulator [Clostridia bacterium]